MTRYLTTRQRVCREYGEAFQRHVLHNAPDGWFKRKDIPLAGFLSHLSYKTISIYESHLFRNLVDRGVLEQAGISYRRAEA